MNLPLFIATRVAFNKQKSFSRFIIRLSIGATALSVAAMIITLAFVNGFQYTVSQKVFSFWGHIRVQHYELNKSLVAEETPIIGSDTVVSILQKNSDIKYVQAFATKTAVLQFNKEIEGSLIKGITNTYDSTQLKPYLIEGRWLQYNDSNYSKEIILSKSLSSQIQASVNDTIKVNFIQPNKNNTYRKLKVVGIYKTGIEEYDKLFVLADIKLIQKINEWQPNEIGGYEIVLHDYKQMEKVSDFLKLPIEWQSKTIKEVYINIFDWLNVMNVNKNLVFVIMGIVAVINLITCLLILVLERTRMVGILKAIGAQNTSIQTIFLYYASIIAGLGILLGVIMGVGLCFLQQQLGIITMDEANYYVAVAPIKMIFWQNLLIITCTAVVCFLSFIIPTFLVKKIQPIKAIRFN